MHFPIKSVAVLFILFNVLMVSVGAEWERKSIQVIKMASTVVYAASAGDDEKAQEKFEVIRNSFYFFMVCGGAVLGAAIALIFVTLLSQNITETTGLDTHVKRCLYFALSAFFSIIFTPMLIRSGWAYASVNPESCFAFAGLMAIGAWWLMKVVNYCLERLSGAAKTKGFKGVQEELTGSLTASQGVAPPPSQPTK